MDAQDNRRADHISVTDVMLAAVSDGCYATLAMSICHHTPIAQFCIGFRRH
jgi:hypothetical protein